MLALINIGKKLPCIPAKDKKSEKLGEKKYVII